MKKKKDPAFDDLKKSVIKPMKDMVNELKTHFSEVSQRYSEKASQEWMPAGTELHSIFKVDEKMEVASKRIQMLNKEVRATHERFREMSEKLSKKYASLAQGLKGFNA